LVGGYPACLPVAVLKREPGRCPVFGVIGDVHAEDELLDVAAYFARLGATIRSS